MNQDVWQLIRDVPLHPPTPQEMAYRHLRTEHKFRSGLAYYPGKDDIDSGHAKLRAQQLEQYLVGSAATGASVGTIGTGRGHNVHVSSSGRPSGGADNALARLEQMQLTLADWQMKELFCAVQNHVPRGQDEVVNIRAIFGNAIATLEALRKVEVEAKRVRWEHERRRQIFDAERNRMLMMRKISETLFRLCFWYPISRA